MAKKKREKHTAHSHKAAEQDTLASLVKRIDAFEGTDSGLFFQYVKQFFSMLLNLKKELTYEEISNAFEKKSNISGSKDSMLAFLKKLPQYEYGGVGISKKNILGLSNEFKGIVLSLSLEPTSTSITAEISNTQAATYGMSFMYLFLRDFFALFYKIPRLLFLKLGLLFGGKTDLPFMILEKQRLDEMRSMISETLYYFDTKRFSLVKKRYRDLFEAFNRLRLEQQQQIYPRLKELRDKIVTADTEEGKIAQIINQLNIAIRKKKTHQIKKQYAQLLATYGRLSVVKQQNLYPRLRKMHRTLQKTGSKKSVDNSDDIILGEIASLSDEITHGSNTNKTHLKNVYIATLDLYGKLSSKNKRQVYYKIKDLKSRVSSN